MDDNNPAPPGFEIATMGLPQGKQPSQDGQFQLRNLSERLEDHLARLRNLTDLPPGEVILTFPESPGTIISVPGVDASLVEDRSPLLAVAFEPSSSGLRLHLEALSPDTVIPFIRFLYTPSYGHVGEWADVPTSVLLHCKMYHLGELYDITELKTQAYVNVLRQCEYGCSSPEKPIDLYQAIAFAYSTLSNPGKVTDAIVQYCVTCCLRHRLHDEAEFRELVFNIKSFNQDLAKVCMQRGYEDESAAVIIRLPYKRYAADTFASTENPAMEDVVHHFHCSDRFDLDPSPKKKQRVVLEGAHKIAGKSLADRMREHRERRRVSKLSLRSAAETPILATADESSASGSITLPMRPLYPDTDIGNKSRNQVSATADTGPSELADWTFKRGVPIRSKARDDAPTDPPILKPSSGDTTAPRSRQDMMALETILCTGPDAESGWLKTDKGGLVPDKEKGINAFREFSNPFDSTMGSYDFRKQPVSEPKKAESTLFVGTEPKAANKATQVVVGNRHTPQRRESFTRAPGATLRGLPSAILPTSNTHIDQGKNVMAYIRRSALETAGQTNAASFVPSNASPTLPTFEPYCAVQSKIPHPPKGLESTIDAQPDGTTAGTLATNKSTLLPRRRSLQDYQMHLIFLEQQEKKRQLMAKQEADSQMPPTKRSELPMDEEFARPDYERLGQRYEQLRRPTMGNQDMKPPLVAKQDTDSMDSPPEVSKSLTAGERALQYYQDQLNMLEAQNKKRLLMARQEADSLKAPFKLPKIFTQKPSALQDCQRPSKMLEARHKEDPFGARAGADGHMPPSEVPKFSTDDELPPADSKSSAKSTALNRGFNEKIAFNAFPSKGLCRLACVPDRSGTCTDCGSSECAPNVYFERQKQISKDQLDNSGYDPVPVINDFKELRPDPLSPGTDVLDKFDFDGFLSSEDDVFSGFSFDGYANASQGANNTEALAQQKDASGGTVESDVDMCDSDVDSDSNVSWVDVDIKLSQDTAIKPAVIPGTAAAADCKQASTSAKRSSSTFEEDDDEWELC